MCVFQNRKENEMSTSKSQKRVEINSKSRHESEKLLDASIKMSQATAPTPADEPSVDDLKSICTLKGPDALTTIETRYGGLEKFLQLLRTDLQNGLDESAKSEMKRRANKFGRNEIAATASKSFVSLVLDAFKDATLIMLIICALISIGLAFYHTHDDNDNSDLSDRQLMASSKNSTLPALKSNFTQSRVHASSDETNIQWIEGTKIVSHAS